MSGVIEAYAVEDVQLAVARTLKNLAADTLLRRAAAGLAVVCGNVLRQRCGGIYGRRVVLLVGAGKNGADALLAGARLRQRGAKVDAIIVTDKVHAMAAQECRAAGAGIIDPGGTSNAKASTALAAADLVVDGICGDQCEPPLAGAAADLVAAIPRNATVVSVDLPSGVHPDTGVILGPHVHADVTVTFGAWKGCLLTAPAAFAAGQVEFVDVGITEALAGEPLIRRFTAAAIADRWPVPSRSDHKYTRGVLGVVAGSQRYPGAAVLACLGAVRAGVGIVRYVGPRRVVDHVLRATPEVVPGAGQVQAWLLGSGVEDDTEQDQAMATALNSGLPCVVDAGALEACVRRRSTGDRAAPAGSVLLTPHAGEAARMLDLLGHSVTRADVEACPMRHATWLAGETDATVLLKGSVTLIASPDGAVFSQADGPPWLATAGSGDVLAGIAGMLMAAGVGAADAGAMAASVHGLAASRVSRGGPASASMVAEAIPATIGDLLRPR